MAPRRAQRTEVPRAAGGCRTVSPGSRAMSIGPQVSGASVRCQPQVADPFSGCYSGQKSIPIAAQQCQVLHYKQKSFKTFLN